MQQNLEVYGRLYDVANLKLKIEELTEKLRLNEIIHKITGELSSGQKNRVSLAKSIKIGRAHVRTPVTRGSRMPSSA